MRILPEHPLVGVEVYVQQIDSDKRKRHARYVWRVCQFSPKRQMADVGSHCRPIWVPVEWCTKVADTVGV